MGKLYLVATPIGNLSDISERALEVLNAADFIAAEDTRHTLKLLNHFNIKKPMISYYEHNKRERGEIIAKRIIEGEDCALVTDAGTPAISDPGEDLVALCAEMEIDVVPIPGPCAFVQALIISGLPTGRFSFEGFLSMNKTSRLKHLDEIKTQTQTLIFHEAPHKLKATLNDLFNVFGDRRISLVKELTKIHETVIRTTLKDAVHLYDELPPKGEFVLVVEGYTEPLVDKEKSMDEIIEEVEVLINSGVDKKTAMKEIATKYEISKRDIYNNMINK